MAQSSDNTTADVAALVNQDNVSMGVDILEIKRMRMALIRTPKLVSRLFTQDEQTYCRKLAQPEYGYATRFAAKSAVCKALGLEGWQAFRPLDIEIHLSSKGRPYVKLFGKIKTAAQDQGVLELPISLSYTHSEAVACALAITQDSVAAARQRVDQKRELAKRFKEARLMLDELKTPEAAPAQESLPGIR